MILYDGFVTSLSLPFSLELRVVERRRRRKEAPLSPPHVAGGFTCASDRVK